MSPRLFSVYYTIYNEASIDSGEAAELGVVARDVSLAEAIGHIMNTRTSEVGGVESIESDSRGINVANSSEYRTGCYESRYIPRPDGVTDATWGRITRLMGCER